MQVPTFLGKRWRSACDESKSKEAGPELGSIQQVSTTEVCVSTLTLKLSQDTSNHTQRPLNESQGEPPSLRLKLSGTRVPLASLHLVISKNQLQQVSVTLRYRRGQYSSDI